MNHKLPHDTKRKNVYIIAGPNGSGKTTFANRFLPDYVKCPNFVNADLIALGLAPFSPATVPIKAGKLVLKEIHEYSRRGLDFGFESTLSGKSYAALIKKLREDRYRITIFFLWVPSATLSLERIKDRVRDGGHSVPPEDVRRRFTRSIANFFKIYKPLSDSWILFNNSGATPKIIARFDGIKEEIIDQVLFTCISKAQE